MAKRKTKARKVLERPQVSGWNTSDADEIRMRQWRGRTEITALEALEPQFGPYGAYRVRSGSGGVYQIEIRDLSGRSNSCGCVDHGVNGLGTCKHIEGVLFALKKKMRPRAFAAAAVKGSPRVEVFLQRDGEPVPVLGGAALNAEIRAFLKPFLAKDGTFRSDPETAARLLAAASEAPAGLRISRHFSPWIERERRRAARKTARTKFLAAVETADLNMLKLPLLPYQREGATHLAFHERALLADEMGLGKTVQAIAACEILAREKGIRRVLVVSPTSVKAEWEEQIARFTGRDEAAGFVAGLYQERLNFIKRPRSLRSSTTSRWSGMQMTSTVSSSPMS